MDKESYRKSLPLNADPQQKLYFLIALQLRAFDASVGIALPQCLFKVMTKLLQKF